MANRIVRWILFSVIFGLLPIGISLLFHIILQSDIYDLKSVSCELLFFIIVLNATALGDVQEMTKYAKMDSLISIFFGISILFTIVAAILYGSISYENMMNGQSLDINIILHISIWLSILSSVLGLIIQILIQKIEAVDVD